MHERSINTFPFAFNMRPKLTDHLLFAGIKSFNFIYKSFISIEEKKQQQKRTRPTAQKPSNMQTWLV